MWNINQCMKPLITTGRFFFNMATGLTGWRENETLQSCFCVRKCRWNVTGSSQVSIKTISSDFGHGQNQVCYKLWPFLRLKEKGSSLDTFNVVYDIP